MNNSGLLLELLASEHPLVMPDAYDALSARLIEMAGFKAIQCSGFSMALASSTAAEPALGFQRNLQITKSIVDAVGVPVMADGEDGFGPPEQVFETVGAFLDIGVSGINIEDQVVSETSERRLTEPGVMSAKLAAARAAATDHKMDLLINARTDALAHASDGGEGVKEAVKRGNRYRQAGADLIFVTGVKTLVNEIDGPVSIAAGMPQNMDAMSIQELRDCGVARVSLPSILLFSAIQAVKRSLAVVRDTERFDELSSRDFLCGMSEVGAILKKKS